MACATKNAADRGMVIELIGSTQMAHQCPEGHDGAAYRIRTDDPLITNEMLYRLS